MFYLLIAWGDYVLSDAGRSARDWAWFLVMYLGLWWVAYRAAVCGAGLLARYLAPGLQAEARNHPRKAGIMWDTARLGWLSVPREQLSREARFGNAPGYDHELPEKIAGALDRRRRRTRRHAENDPG